MSLSKQSIEELLSISYVTAIVSKTGNTWEVVPNDFGVDLGIRRIARNNNKIVDMGVVFDCQLKSTINWNADNNFIVYDMEAEAYNRIIFRNKESVYPCILVLFCLPKEEKDWLHNDHQNLILKHSCYFYFIEDEATSNKQSIRIRIPKENLFTPDIVKTLIEKHKKGGMK